MEGAALKILGAVFILLSSGGAGAWASWCFKRRLELLERLRQMIYFLKGEITYSHAPLKEALERAGRRGKGSLGNLFLAVSSEIGRGQGESFGEIWEKEMEKLCSGPEGRLLKSQDIRELCRLGEHLGYLDVDMQEKMLCLYLEELDFSIGQLRGCKQERCRLYGSLGILGGLFLVIAMC